MTDTPKFPRQSDDSFHINRDKLAPATEKRYASCCGAFIDWCNANAHCPLPAADDTVAEYLAHAVASGTPWSAIKTIRSAIRRMHVHNNAPDPTQTSGFKKAYKAFETRMQSVGVAPKPQDDKTTAKPVARTARDMAPDAVGALADRTGRPLIEAACEIAFEDASAALRTNYTGSCLRFATWCRAHQLRPYPAKVGTVASYVRALAQSGRADSTIRTDLTGIRSVHERTGFPELTMSPDLRAASRAAQKMARQNKALQAEANQVDNLAAAEVPPGAPHGLCWTEIEAMVAACARTPCDLRNRALILTGYVTAANPEALAGMAVGDVSELTALRVRDRTVALNLHRAADAVAAEALLDWLTCAEGPDGANEAAPLFPPLARGRDRRDRALTPRDVNAVLVRVTAAAGIDGRITGRSLREGRLLDAARAGATLAEIKSLGGLIDDQSGLRILARERELRAGETDIAGPDEPRAPVPSPLHTARVHGTTIRVVWGAIPGADEAEAA